MDTLVCSSARGSLASKRIKPHRRYLFYRAYAAVAFVGWNVSALAFGAFGKPSASLELLAAALLLPPIRLFLNWAAYPFAYSAFGHLLPTSPPDEPALATSRWGGRVGLLSANAPLTFRVLPSGLVVETMGGRAFVPREAFARLTARRFFGGGRLEHLSPEVRSPIEIPSREAFDALVRVASARLVGATEHRARGVRGRGAAEAYAPYTSARHDPPQRAARVSQGPHSARRQARRVAASTRTPFL